MNQRQEGKQGNEQIKIARNKKIREAATARRKEEGEEESLGEVR